MTRIDPPADGYAIVDQLKSAIVDGNGVAKSFVQDRFNTLFRWVKQASTWDEGTLWTPTLSASTTAPTLGSGGSFEQAGSYVLIGTTCTAEFRFRFGTTSPAAGSGTYLVDLPFPYSARDQLYPVCGVGYVFDSSGGDLWVTVLRLRSGSTQQAEMFVTSTGTIAVNNSNPFTFGASDIVSGKLTYQIAT